MQKLIVAGGIRLEGECLVHGAKNAVLPILAACVLIRGTVRLENCPQLNDVENMLAILKTLGCKSRRDGGAVEVDARDMNACELPEHLSKELRSSIFLLGPLLARIGSAVVSYPGGCEIGNRPIDLHLSGLRALNVAICEDGGRIHCDGGKMIGGTIHLDYPSVGATENIMMAAVAAEGDTTILNAAREPEIVDLMYFLNAAGFSVFGAGSSTVQIRGGGTGREVCYRVMPDRIVAGTLLTAACITGGDVFVCDAVPAHLTGTIAKLREAGARIDCEGAGARLRGPVRPRELKLVETLPHPGFPTDMQAQIFALCSVADGTSVIVENVFENRFKHAQELKRMGADCCIRDRTAVIRGVRRLTGAQVACRDLRGGAALVLAGLRAEGVTTVLHAEIMDRGYETIERTLSTLGAQITREAE